MRRFWSYISNGIYSIGCTGQAVYVYDTAGNELASFKEIRYGYNAVFCPNKNLFLVKSTSAYLGVYSLDTLHITKKVKYSNIDGGQDDGYCFSQNGKFFYNIERQGSSLNSVISIYDTDSFARVGMFLKEDAQTEPSMIEQDTDGQIYVLGFLRGDHGVFTNGFISKFNSDGLVQSRVISENKYDFYQEFKHLELAGFTDMAKQWSGLKQKAGIENKKYPLSKLWKES